MSVAAGSTNAPRLGADAVERYERDGYLRHAEPVFSSTKFEKLCRHFDDTLRALPTHVRPEDIDVPHFTDLALFDWLLDDEVLDLVEPIVGPDIALFSSHFICKPPSTGRRVPWHKDSDYWHGRLEPQDIVTVWLAIDASTADNGALKVIPGTHHLHALSEYDAVDAVLNVFSTEIKRRTIPVERAVTIELEPNQASLHHARMVHGSDANTSNTRRCGYTMRYMSTRTRFVDTPRNDGHVIFLARGKDHANNRYASASERHDHLLAGRRGPRGH